MVAAQDATGDIMQMGQDRMVGQGKGAHHAQRWALLFHLEQRVAGSGRAGKGELEASIDAVIGWHSQLIKSRVPKVG